MTKSSLRREAKTAPVSINKSKQVFPAWRQRLFARRFGRPTLFIAAFALLGGIASFAVFAATEPTGRITGFDSRCVDVRDGQHYKGNTVRLWSCDGSDAQKWTIKSDGTIRNTDSWCLEAQPLRSGMYSSVWLWPCNGSAAQSWSIQRSGALVNPESGLCLTASDGSAPDNSILVMNACNAANTQRWSTPTVAGDKGSL